jgi:hypothetical protein
LNKATTNRNDLFIVVSPEKPMQVQLSGILTDDSVVISATVKTAVFQCKNNPNRHLIGSTIFSP